MSPGKRLKSRAAAIHNFNEWVKYQNMRRHFYEFSHHLFRGMDSSVLLINVADITAVSFQYGSKHTKELDQPRKLYGFFCIEHKVVLS